MTRKKAHLTKPNPRIGLDLHADGRVIVAPMDYLDGQFGAYRLACSQSGAKYDATLKVNIVLPDLIPGLCEALRQAGTQPVIAPSLAAILKGRALEARAEIEAAKGRIANLTAHLAARNLSLYPFQVAGIAWLAGRRSALLCDEPGLGKTVEGAMTINRVTPRAIIICPASLKGNWVRELGIWRPELMPVVLQGRNSFCWPQPGQVVILNPDILPRVEESDDEGNSVKVNPYADCPSEIELIADEFHQFKGAKTKRTQSFRALARAVRKAGGRTIGMTGTPLLNRPQELYSLLSNLDLLKETFGDYYGMIRAWNGKSHAVGNDWGPPSAAVGQILKRVMLRRRREEVLPDLPTKTRAVIPVDIDDKTRDLCARARAAIEASGVSLEQMVADGKVTGAAFEVIAKTRAALAIAKIPAMMELLDQYEAEETAVIVFSAHRAPIQALAHRAGWAWFTGETPAAERTEIVRRFQEGAFRGLGTTIGAGGVGHTLTFAHHELFVDQDWTPALNCQAEDRTCRIGQDRGVIIRIMVAPDTIDDHVAALLIHKQKIIDGSIEKAATKAAEIPQAVDPAQLERAAQDVGAVQRRDTARRGPGRPSEEWAKATLLGLAARKAFRARDSGFGASLAAQLQSRGELSEKQWIYAVRLARSYAKEVGQCPG